MITCIPKVIYPWFDKNAPSDLPALPLVTSQDLLTVAMRIYWEFHDLVIAYDMLRQTLIDRNKEIEKSVEKQKSLAIPDDDEILQIGRSRFFEIIHAEDLMMAEIARTSARSIIINSWILVERALGESFSSLHNLNNGSIPKSKSYRWDEFKKKFGAFGIILEKTPGFDDANLCRVVNNAIKHSGMVSLEMTKSSQFHGKEGHNVRDILIEPQAMITAAYGFGIAVIEAVDEKISPQK